MFNVRLLYGVKQLKAINYSTGVRKKNEFEEYYSSLKVKKLVR